MNLSIDLFDISIADAIELGQGANSDFSSNFSDGRSDGKNNFEPIAYQWFNSDYRRGYLTGVAIRIGIEYAQIYDVDSDKVIFV